MSNEQNNDALQAVEAMPQGLGEAQAQIDALFAKSKVLPERGREEVKNILTELAVDKAKEMGATAWEKYSEQALQKLDSTFAELGIDLPMQLEILEVLDRYVDAQVNQGLEDARVGLDLLGQSIDVRLSRTGAEVAMKELSGDFDFGAIQSNFTYSPESGLQFKMDAQAGAALIEMSGTGKEITGGRVVLDIKGRQMELVKLGDSYEVTLHMGDHLKLASALDPSGRVAPSVEIPFREGTLSMQPTITFPSGREGGAALEGLQLNLQAGDRQLSVSSADGQSGQLEYSRSTTTDRGRQITASATVSTDAQARSAEANVQVIF